ncbi:hypothetical protein CXG81DRAFT_9339 [Caulochytrium protostelioides]|uniref:orotate phosphoribosyltransferase n=1 Tax=Caulochytrium protostelioides TaxID=1555241 RepID=A0A4P9XDI5_9FUNG|nr:hypothetical protein CXG81DRAFT_9339 [Caulochytrium protostelioides]|eukprot:RKP03577.1 hypothetical protein CXG81DRAFT_9339 [Caulochytrium protostelioides]
MKDFQREFIQFALDHEVLRFGAFTLKSGRTSPYFFNLGQFQTGKALAQLGSFYARAYQALLAEEEAAAASPAAPRVLFGPAYKGIPIVSAMAVSLADRHDIDAPWAFNRKEKKDHGEGGQLVGAPVAGRRVLIVDDVITAGTAINESMVLLRAAQAEVTDVLIALDRQERASETDPLSAIQKVEQTHGVRVHTIITLAHVMAYLEEKGETAILETMRPYQAKYGIF